MVSFRTFPGESGGLYVLKHVRGAVYLMPSADEEISLGFMCSGLCAVVWISQQRSYAAVRGKEDYSVLLDLLPLLANPLYRHSWTLPELGER